MRRVVHLPLPVPLQDRQEAVQQTALVQLRMLAAMEPPRPTVVYLTGIRAVVVARRDRTARATMGLMKREAPGMQAAAARAVRPEVTLAHRLVRGHSLVGAAVAMEALAALAGHMVVAALAIIQQGVKG